MRKYRQRLIYIVFTIILAIPAIYGQQGKSAEAAKKKEKIERIQKREYQKARKRTLKHRREIQTKETRKRMDEADKRAVAYNKQNDPGFFQRIFGRKRFKK
jgi:Flp pilus assembly protein TadB